MEPEGWERGRSPFPPTDGYKDYSGRDLTAHYLSNSDVLSHAFLNGVNIDDNVFIGVGLDHAELAESTISRSRFANSTLAISDIVRTNVTDTEFDTCDFTNGDWRESRFERVKFRDCKFDHTTINLCSFASCEFLGLSTSALDHRSVSYNTFARCTFEYQASDPLVIGRNFGLPLVPGARLPIAVSTGMTLEQVCALSSQGDVTVADLVQAIEQESVSPKPRLKKLRLQFISNILGLLAQEGRISPASLIYIEGIFIRLAKAASDETDFLAAMGALVNVRNALYEVAARARASASRSADTCDTVILAFKSTFSKDEVAAFVNALSEIIFGRPGDIVVRSIRPGSTIVECAFSVAASVGTVLAAINLLLSQANTLVKRATALRSSIRRFQGAAVKEKRTHNKRLPAKVPAILDPGSVMPELIPLRAAVERDGRILILFDERAEVALSALHEGVKRRRKQV